MVNIVEPWRDPAAEPEHASRGMPEDDFEFEE